MRRFKVLSLVMALMLLVISSSSFAAEEEMAEHLSYFRFEPDIITNYIKRGKTLGYVRLTVEIMVSHDTDLEVLQHHAPLLRDAILQLFGHQEELRVKSLTGREELRIECLNLVNDLLVRESGSKLAKDLLFTKYLYQ